MYIRKDKRTGHLPDMKKVLLAEDDTRLGESGAESVILGYTEIPLLVSQTSMRKRRLNMQFQRSFKRVYAD